MEPASYKYHFKVIMIGNSSCGKSSILRQFAEQRFDSNYAMTIGCDFFSRIITHENTAVKLACWDASGQESFRSITRSYYRGSVGAIVCFDLTNRDSFNEINSWVSDVKENSKTEVSCVLVGNKSDLVNQREVTTEEAQTFADTNGLKYLETSAKTGDNIDETFYLVCRLVLQKINEGKIDPAQLGGQGSRINPSSLKQGHQIGSSSGSSSAKASSVTPGQKNNSSSSSGEEKKPCCGKD